MQVQCVFTEWNCHLMIRREKWFGFCIFFLRLQWKDIFIIGFLRWATGPFNNTLSSARVWTVWVVWHERFSYSWGKKKVMLRTSVHQSGLSNICITDTHTGPTAPMKQIQFSMNNIRDFDCCLLCCEYPTFLNSLILNQVLCNEKLCFSNQYSQGRMFYIACTKLEINEPESTIVNILP